MERWSQQSLATFLRVAYGHLRVGVKRALIIQRSRARSGQRRSESGALDSARGDNLYFFLFFA
jgi:hypothetical protein